MASINMIFDPARSKRLVQSEILVAMTLGIGIDALEIGTSVLTVG